MMRSQTEYKNKYLQPEYLDNMPLPKPYQPEEVIVPMFIKERVPRSGIEDTKPASKWCEQGFNSFAENPALMLKKADTDDLEISPSKQNLVIVDGWGMIYVHLCVILI